MKKTVILLTLSMLLIMATEPAFSQYDPQAKEILDRVSSKYAAMNAIRADFIYKLENKEAGTEEEVEGLIHIKDDLFKLEMLNKSIWFDGELIREYDNDFQEYTIREYDSDTEGINLSTVLNLYKKDFKYRIREQDAKSYKVELIPLDVESRSFNKIIMDISTGYEVRSFTYFEKNGNLVSTEVKTFEEKPNLKLKFFDFFQANLEVIDSVDLR